MHKVMITLGVAFMMMATAILCHDCQGWFESGVWCSTTIFGALNMFRLDYEWNGFIDQLQIVHSFLSLPLYLVAMSTGILVFLLGCNGSDELG